LLDIMKSENPPRRLVRGNMILSVRYGFGDASGGGFGASWESEEGVAYRFGVWNETKNKGRSSNYRELRNLVEALETMCLGSKLGACEIYFFTDNSTAERAYHKGTSSNEDLHELVFRLRKLELD
jgi:ribonuclease HI